MSLFSTTFPDDIDAMIVGLNPSTQEFTVEHRDGLVELMSLFRMNDAMAEGLRLAYEPSFARMWSGRHTH